MCCAASAIRSASSRSRSGRTRRNGGVRRHIMIKVKRLGHATIATPDLEAQVDYYGRLLGLSVIERSKDRVFLGSKQGLEAIELVKGKPNDLKRVSFQIAPGTDLGEVVKELGKLGIKAGRRKTCRPASLTQ